MQTQQAIDLEYDLYCQSVVNDYELQQSQHPTKDYTCPHCGTKQFIFTDDWNSCKECDFTL